MTAGNLVWILDEQVVGEIVSHGAYFSRVKFFVDGIEHEEFVDNTDLIAYELYEE
jgi:hypothetical protein